MSNKKCKGLAKAAILVLVLLAATHTASAIGIDLEKDTIPHNATYRVGDTVTYSLRVCNPTTTLSYTVDVYDEYPDGTDKLDFNGVLIVDDLTLAPGACWEDTITYVVEEADVTPDNEIWNWLYVEGTSQDGEPITGMVSKVSEIIIPPPPPPSGECKLRLYGEDNIGAAFPYTDPEAPFDPQSLEAPRKDFVTFNPALMEGIVVNNIDAKQKVFVRQWFVPEYAEPTGRVWIDEPNEYVSEDVVTEYTYMFVDKYYNPMAATALSPTGAYWTKFWFPIADNSEQIGLDGFDVNGDGVDDMVVLKAVGDFNEDGKKDIMISTQTFELKEGEEIQFLDHKIVVKNVEVISGTPPLISMVVDVYYTGNDEPQRIAQNLMAQILPGQYVSAGRHTVINAQPNFYESWFLQAVATDGDKAYVVVGRLLHTGESFFVDGAEYAVAMIYGPDKDSVKYITIRNPVPEHEDVNLEDLSVIKEAVMDREPIPILPPFNRIHTMIDDINIPHSDRCIEEYCEDCPMCYVDDDECINEAYNSVEERIIRGVEPLVIYFTGKDIEPRFHTNLLEILTEKKGYTTKPVDILFEIDCTGSMEDEIDVVKTSAKDIMNEIRTLAPDSRFGLVSFRDYPGSYSSCNYSGNYGGSGDWAYKLEQALTSDTGALETAINGLTASGGGDWPEDYTRVLYEAANDLNISWRDDAVKIVIIFGDAPTHDCDFYAVSFGADPGRNEAIGDADDLDFETVVAELAAKGIIVLAVDSSSSQSPNEEGEDLVSLRTDANYAAQSFKYMAEETGGAYRKLTDAGDLPEVVVELITEVLPVEEGWKWKHIHVLPDFYKEFVYPALPDIDGGIGDFLVTLSLTAPNACNERVMFAYDAEVTEGLYMNVNTSNTIVVNKGDFDNDCDVDFDDFVEFAAVYNTACGDLSYNEVGDFDNDCDVDFDDFVEFAAVYGSTVC